MAKSFAFYALILSLIFVGEDSVESGKMKFTTVHSESDSDEDSYYDEDNYDEDNYYENNYDEDNHDYNDYDDDYDDIPKKPKDEENPALSCLLFGDDACLVQCFMVARVYKFESAGYCDEHQKCQCHYNKSTFGRSWRRKIIAKGIYHQIKKSNPLIYSSIREAIEDPFKTGEEIKRLLKPVISPYKYSTMQILDYSIAALYTTNGVLNQKSVQRLISMQFDEIAARGRDDLYIDMMFRDNFENALKTANDATLYNLTFRVRQLNNKTLSDILEKFLKDKNIPEPKVELYGQKDTLEIIINIVINEIINRNDEKYNKLVEYFGSDYVDEIKGHLKSWTM